MSAKQKKFQRTSTRMSPDGHTVFVWLRMDRRKYEFARAEAAQHADAYPECTAEDELEGFLSSDVDKRMDDLNWSPPVEVEDLYLANTTSNERVTIDEEDGILF